MNQALIFWFFCIKAKVDAMGRGIETIDINKNHLLTININEYSSGIYYVSYIGEKVITIIGKIEKL